MRTFSEKAMNQHIANTARHIAAIVAVFGTLLTVGGTLTLAEHYAQSDAATRISAQGASVRTVA
jgi:hypothetical protein